MPELLDIQRRFAASLRDAGTPGRARPWLAGEPAQVEQRLAIYRANAATATLKALSAAYPVVCRVVGETFFERLARAYHRATPSTSGDLSDRGSEFGAFLAAFPHAQSMPYLPELARLEWLVHRAYAACDAGPWARKALQAVPPERHGAIRFEWAAGTALVASEFPLAHIWAIHQPGYMGDFGVDWTRSERVLVSREGFRVTVSALGAGDAAFIARALAGAALDDATAAALEADAGFDLAALLHGAMASRLICGFTLDQET
jgi:hypothetical protein